MASPSSAVTGDAVADPGTLRMYLGYTRLRCRDMGTIHIGVARLYDQCVRAFSGHTYLLFRRTQNHACASRTYQDHLVRRCHQIYVEIVGLIRAETRH